MECNEVFSVSTSISLLRPQARGDKRFIETLASPVSSTLSAPATLPTSPVSSHTPRHPRVLAVPDISVIQPDATANFDGYGYDDPDKLADSSHRSIRHATTDLSHADTAVIEERNKSQPRRWLYLCHCTRQLIAIKVFYFAFIGAIGVVLPYAAVFMKQLGMSAFQIGVISGIRPGLGFISGPLWGSVADRFRIRRVLLLVSVLAWLAFFVGFYFIPAAARVSTCPETLVPHRERILSRPTRDLHESNASFYIAPYNSSYLDSSEDNETSGDHDLLRENLSWLYDPEGLHRVFVACILIICGGELFQAPTTALSDAATLEILGREGMEHYGAQRAWGSVGWAISPAVLSSFAVGALLSSHRVSETICGVSVVFTDYHLVTYVYMVIMIFALVAAFKINFNTGHNSDATSEKEKAGQHNTLAIFKFFLNVHYGSWIVTTFFVGVCNGIIWGFLFWHLDNLGATQLLMGVSGVIACLFEFGAFFVVEYGIKYVGHMGIMYIGLLGYVIRFVAYASLVNPWWVLPAEALQGVTFSFIWVSLTSYSAASVPSVSLATIQGIMHGVYFGLGNGLGHFLGGVLIGTYGAAATFYGCGVATGVWLVLFFALQKMSTKPTNQFSYQNMDTTGEPTTRSTTTIES